MLESVSLFTQVCVAILLEVAPFLLLGSLASGLFEVFVPRESLERLMPRSPVAGVAAGIVLGMVMPCCECGIVPLIRRLLAKGVPPATAMTFMLAGPVINPVVLASTFVAFKGDTGVVALRCALVALIAAVIGLTLRSRRPEDLLLANPAPIRSACGCSSEPDRAPGLAATERRAPAPWPASPSSPGPSGPPASAEPSGIPGGDAAGADAPAPVQPRSLAAARHSVPGDPAVSRPTGQPTGLLPAAFAGPLFGSMADAISLEKARAPSLLSRLDHVLVHAQADFLEMFRVLVYGAVIAGAFKALVPPDVVGLIEKDLLLAVTGMMLLAVGLSLCSQADAFVAASFTGFPPAALLAFLSLGPVLDVKLALMWRGSFRPEVVRLLIAVPAVMVFSACMLLGALDKVFP